MLLEIACFDLDSALIAAKSGAHRIELCHDYSVGGVTPSREIIKMARKNINCELIVMIRPRGGNFVYYDSEIDLMKKEIEFCKSNGVDGVVFGILTSNKKIDLLQCTSLLELARPMKVTFHRAFDEIKNQEEATQQLIRCGVHRILTSGGAKTAIEGCSRIQGLVSSFGKEITFVVGGGVRSQNLEDLILKTSAQQYHSSGIGKDGRIDSLEIKKLLSIISK